MDGEDGGDTTDADEKDDDEEEDEEVVFEAFARILGGEKRMCEIHGLKILFAAALASSSSLLTPLFVDAFKTEESDEEDDEEEEEFATRLFEVVVPVAIAIVAESLPFSLAFLGRDVRVLIALFDLCNQVNWLESYP